MSEESGLVRWLGHGTVMFVSPSGTTLLVDPWLEDNPSTPDNWRTIERVDAILVTHGHFDHISDAPSIALQSNAPVVSTSEIAAYLGQEGVTNTVEMNQGGSIDLAELKITMVPAQHSSGCPAAEGSSDQVRVHLEGGNPVGFVIRGADFGTVYVAGDTSVFGDMRVIRDLYHPELAVLPIDGRFNMGPDEAAYACELLGVERVVPYHWGTFPILTGTPAQLKVALEGRGVNCEVLDIAPGESIFLATR